MALDNPIRIIAGEAYRQANFAIEYQADAENTSGLHNK